MEQKKNNFATVCNLLIDIVNMNFGNSCKLIHFAEKRESLDYLSLH